MSKKLRYRIKKALVYLKNGWYNSPPKIDRRCDRRKQFERIRNKRHKQYDNKDPS